MSLKVFAFKPDSCGYVLCNALYLMSHIRSMKLFRQAPTSESRNSKPLVDGKKGVATLCTYLITTFIAGTKNQSIRRSYY